MIVHLTTTLQVCKFYTVEKYNVRKNTQFEEVDMRHFKNIFEILSLETLIFPDVHQSFVFLYFWKNLPASLPRVLNWKGTLQ